ncbi:MAG: ethanolamine ammonia-lyase subunit EutC [Clostridiales bacterium]|nr:ethanolamine ammonia-lyase subunit EutC [Clostridiales bacterium]
MNENDIKTIIEKVIAELSLAGSTPDSSAAAENSVPADNNAAVCCGRAEEPVVVEDGYIDDITEHDLKEQFFVPNPEDKEGYIRMKQFTPARIGVWRAGPRYNTVSSLRFKADHATAQDAVFTSVPDEFVAECGFVASQTVCVDKDEYLTRPDLGKVLSVSERKRLKEELPKNAKVQLVVGDGLSSAAIIANIKEIMLSLKQGLRSYGIETGPIPFIKYARVGVEDEIGELTGSDVICLFIGERPGLVTAESMSAYIAYKPMINMPEARRTVVSNIHRGGSLPIETGAHIADIIKLMLDKKVSGVDLKL